MNPKNTLKMKRLRNKKSGRKKRNLKGGVHSLSRFSSMSKNMFEKARTVVGQAAETGVTDAAQQAVLIAARTGKAAAGTAATVAAGTAATAAKVITSGLPEILDELINKFIEILNKNKNYFQLIIDNLPSIPNLGSFKSLIQSVVQNSQLYLKNRFRMMFLFNPQTIVESDEHLQTIEPLIDDDVKNALVATILSYNFEKIENPSQEDDNKAVLNILTKASNKGEKWFQITDYNSVFVNSSSDENSNSVNIGLNFENIQDNSQPITYNLSEEFSYRKDIMKDGKISKFFVLKLPSEQTIITIRGTQSFTDVTIDLNSSTQTLENVLNSTEFTFDFDDKLKQCSFHKGFLLSSLKIFKKIYQNYLYELPNNARVLICGHSMGGAEAAILGLLVRFCNTLQSKNINLKIITFNPGTYIVRNDAYDTMLSELHLPSELEQPAFVNKIFLSAGDLISSCSLENIIQTVYILQQTDGVKLSSVLENFQRAMSTNKQKKTYTSLLEVGEDDIVTVCKKNTKKGYIQLPFLITGPISVKTHKISNFFEKILPSDHKLRTEENDENKRGLSIMGNLSSLILKIPNILSKLKMMSSPEKMSFEVPNFRDFYGQISEKKELMNYLTNSIRGKIDVFVISLSKIEDVEGKQKFQKLFSISSLDDLKEKQTEIAISEDILAQFESIHDGNGGTYSRKKRKGKTSKKSSFKRNLKQKGGSPEGVVLLILQIYLGFTFCPLLTIVFLFSCGPMICLHLLASF